MLENATRELRTNFNEYYECISKTPLFDSFARECLNKNYDVNKESYEQVIKELAQINKIDATTKENEDEEKEGDDEEEEKPTEIKVEEEIPIESQSESTSTLISNILDNFRLEIPTQSVDENEKPQQEQEQQEGEVPPPPGAPPPPRSPKKPKLKPEVSMKGLFWGKFTYKVRSLIFHFHLFLTHLSQLHPQMKNFHSTKTSKAMSTN